MAGLWEWYRGLPPRERGLVAAFLTIIVGTLPCYGLGLALILSAPRTVTAPERSPTPAPTVVVA
ncbi:MAG TPA: hypothetical protein VKZ60_15780, partial [Chloroflexota bacterium]|nr:hypothetical protein [Chloroflexota bacterium]